MHERPSHLRAAVIATRLGVSERTVRRWIADGTVPSMKIGGARLIAEADLEQLLTTQVPTTPSTAKGD